MPERLVILIAEDNPADRLLLAAIVRREGHRVVTAGNGREALEAFRQERPQLVLMDALMPVMDGFESARQIKAEAGEALVPVIFLTSLSDSEALARCLEAGDDFLAKPYDRIVLAAKIRAMDRLRRLQTTVLEQRDLIARQAEHLMAEQRVAKAVIDKVTHSGCLDAQNIRYLQSPYALFNGDLLLAAYKPSGGMHLLLGDFTGHGLPAAIGAMPLAEVFYAMTSKGYSMADILCEMNARLKRILPVGVFCCATMLNLSFHRRLVEVWNGGLPDGYLLRADGGELQPLVSKHLPLGVLEADAFDETYEVHPLEPGDRVLLLSDGLLEARDAAQQAFGEERLLEVLRQGFPAECLFEAIQRALQRFRGEAEDDVSLLEVCFADDLPLARRRVDFSDSGQLMPLDWSASFRFDTQALQHANPLPFLLHLLLEVRGLRGQTAALYTVLTELYSNALEHGVLGLDSALKRDPSGFAQYYEERRRRLAQLREGFVRFELQLLPEGEGGRLRLCVEDSGRGFDAAARLAAPVESGSLAGRGLRLITQLAQNCRWYDEGRGVSVEFAWSAEA